MRSRAGIAIVLLAVLATASAFGARGSAATRSKGGRLAAFRSCADLLRYAKSQTLPFVSAYGLGRAGRALSPQVPAPTAAGDNSPQQGVDYSGTNVQEAGVDEPDIVKTNGSTMFTVENGELESVDVSNSKPKLLDTVTLRHGFNTQLLLSGTHLLVLSGGGAFVEPLPAGPAIMIEPLPSSTTLTELDVSNPASLKVIKTLTIDGQYVDARMVGSVVRLVSSTSIPVNLPYVTATGTGPAAVGVATAKNKRIVATSRAAAWLPSYRLGKRAARPLVQCRSVRHPVRFSGLGMLTVTTIDLSRGLAPLDSIAVMTDGRIVYASPTRLYVATEPWTVRPLPATPNVAPQSATTTIDAFGIADPTKTTYIGSGNVSGFLLSQWSLSEFDGVLRVVSTDAPAWWTNGQPQSETFLTTLRVKRGGLTQLGRLDGLGPGDRVYAVRMIGETAYVVTFRQVDPLYTIGLGDPAHPKLNGKLELPGYSSYLHQISDTLLLGIGQNVDPQTNEPSGTLVSLFDVSNPAHPARLAEASLGQGWSQAESDHHAFLYWPQTGLVVIPFGQQAVAMHVARSGIDELGRIVHGQAKQSQLPQIDRSVVVGRSLLTISNAGVASNDRTTLAPLGWARFPAPPPTPVPLPGAPTPAG